MYLDEGELSTLRKNIIGWYPFKKGSSLLEIWEGQADLNNIDVNEKFDYIAIIGIGTKNLEELIKLAKEKLKPEGIILIAVDNKLGIENLCLERTEETQKITRRILEEVLNNNEFTNQKFYYPMPNYKTTNVIFTDECLPNFETINRSLTLYEDDVLVALDEKKRIQAVIEENAELFKEFANSFLVECSKNKLEENNICFVSYSNIRKQEFRIKTIIQGEEVHKYNASEKSKLHIENIKKNIDILKKSGLNTIDTYDDEKIISKYQNEELLLDKIIINKLKAERKDEAIDLISKFKDELMKKLDEKVELENNCFDKYGIDYQKEQIENLHFIKNGLWDLICQNCFYIENEFYFYDQEWNEENIPIEFIMYRAIKYFKELNKFISVDALYKDLKLQKEQIDIFDKLDDTLQKKIRDEKMWKAHIDRKGILELQDRLNKLQIENNNFKAKIIQDGARIKDLENGIDEAIATIKKREEEKEAITNSKSWKITKPLRTVSQILSRSK